MVMAENGPLVAKMLEDGGASSVTLHTYPGMAHSSCNQEEAHVREFLAMALK